MNNFSDRKISRRDFLKTSSILGAAVGTASIFRYVPEATAQATIYSMPGPIPLDIDPSVKIIRSYCLMCHSNCGIQCLVDKNGRLVKIDGNPYHPNNLDPHIPYETDPNTTLRGRLCAKGQAGIEQVYTPIRIKHPLKRVGPRGSHKWQVISWEQAFTEIIEGGNLFGEGYVDGLRAIRDLNTPIDPAAPELGPKANQFVFLVGRWQNGRKQLTDRFAGDAYGTINRRIDHTSICELSHHIAHGFVFGGKEHFKPDVLNSKYLIIWGTTPLEAGFPMIAFARKLMQFKKDGGKLVVVDPRFSNTASKADLWVPVKPGTDAALAMGMIRWLIDNNKYDAGFLSNTTKEAANRNGESTWTNASYLVRLDNMKLLRADEAGLAGGTKEQFVVWANGAPQIHSSVDRGELEVAQTVNDISCKSAFTLLKEEAQKMSIAEYAQECGIDAGIIEGMASDFAKAGKQAATTMYRGAVQHTNGTYNALSIIALNLLVGNINWKGGYVGGGGGYKFMGGNKEQPYDIAKMHPEKMTAKGVKISREGLKYEDSTEFKNNGYPATRPWFPLTSNVWQEAFAGIATGYPYPVKAVMLSMGNPTYSIPGVKEILEDTFKDTKKVPLFIVCDRVMSETAALADYILPEVSYLERFETEGTAPIIMTKAQSFRQPILQESDGRVLPKPKPVWPDAKLAEDIVIEIARRMNLPGFGPDGFGPGTPLNEARDWYEKLAANIANEGDGVPGGTETEKIAYVLDRGGRFENADKAYDGNQVHHKYTGICNLYVERLATTKDSMTGKLFSGLPKYEPIKDAKGNEIEKQDRAQYPFQLVTHKLVFHTQSRTAENRYLMALMPQNYIEINIQDAQKLGIQTGDKVRVTSASNTKGVVGFAKVSEGIRPGVVNIPQSYGHWEYGSQKWESDSPHPHPGEEEYPQGEWKNEKYAAGVTGNPVMRLDDSVGNVGLQDLIGGSSSFYDTWVKVEKA